MTKRPIDRAMADSKQAPKMNERTCDGCHFCLENYWGGESYGKCEYASSQYGKDAPDFDGMKPGDTNGYNAWLEVGPKFGCVKWRKK